MPTSKLALRPTRNLYQNCRIYNIDDKLIFCSALKRAQWYLDRGLAKVVCQDPFSVKLLFKCKGDGNSGDPYYLQDLINQCVVCGTKDNLTRHHCVGWAYRKHFPEEIKNHSHHDVLLVCVSCHDEYEKTAKKFKEKLSQEYNVPITFTILNKENFIQGIHLKGDACALSGPHKDKIPKERKEFLLNRIEKIIGRTPTEEDLFELKKFKPNLHVLTHAKLIVEKLTSYYLIDEFCIRWRKHFVETMHPKFLPKFWQVDKKINPERSKYSKLL